MKILFVTTVSNTVNLFLIPHIKQLVDQGHQVDVAFNTVQEVKKDVIELGCKVHNIEFQRSPLRRQNISAYIKLKKIIMAEKYNIVHTHTPVSSACVRLACRKLKDVKVIYTAHGFHFYKGAPLLNWLFFYPIEKWLSRYTDALITINREDYQRAKNKFKSKVIKYIPGIGLDTSKYSERKIDKKLIREQLGVPYKSLVILSVGELNYNKNHEVIIKAIAKMNNANIYYLICGQGPQEEYLKNLAKEMNLEKNIKFLGFRQDIPEICKVSNVFAFPSRREGLGLAALEAMASGLPIVTSFLHGIKDYSVDGVTGYVSDVEDVDGFKRALEQILYNKELSKKMGEHNSVFVEKYDLKNVKSLMNKIYSDILQKNN